MALSQIHPALLGEYIRKLGGSKPTKKLHLSARRRFFDQLVLRHVIVLNPAASVRAPKHSVVEGKTPALSVEQAQRLLALMETTHVVGLRDRAIIATLIYTAARVGAVAKLRLKDYYPDGGTSGGFALMRRAARRGPFPRATMWKCTSRSMSGRQGLRRTLMSLPSSARRCARPRC